MYISDLSLDFCFWRETKPTSERKCGKDGKWNRRNINLWTTFSFTRELREFCKTMRPQQISWDWSCAYSLGVWDIINLTNSTSFTEKTSKIEGREFTAVHLEDFRTALREIVLKIFCGHLDKRWLESNEVRVYKLD